MNHIAQLQEGSSVRGLKKLTAAALGALALMGAAPAMADVIKFESINPVTYDGKETFGEKGYAMLVIDSPASESGTGFAGAVLNGQDSYTCAVAACPFGNDSNYYAGVNDGALKISRDDHQAFRLYSLDYAFLAPLEGLAGYSYGQLTVTGQIAGGGSTLATFNFPILESGHSPFLSASLSAAFGNTQFSSVVVSSCMWNDVGACANPADNLGQFAIDNLTLAAVPEPSTYAMMGLGLAAIGLVSRRRAKKQVNA